MEPSEITLIIDEPKLIIDEVLEKKEKDPEVLLDEAEKDIEREILFLQEQLILSREIKRKKELHKEAKTKKIETLKNEMAMKTLQYNMEMADILKQIEDLENNKTMDIDKIIDEIDNNILDNISNTNFLTNVKTNTNTLKSKNTRIVVKRRPLHEVISQPTKFKTTIKGTEFVCYTEDGRKIIGYNKNGKNENEINTFSTLNEWLEHSIASVCNNGTSKSVYEVVFYYNNMKKEWRQLKMDYNGETLTLN